MKFFLDFVTCYGSCSSGDRPQAEEAKLLVVEEHRRCSRRKRGRWRVRGVREWRPSLSSISEDNSSIAERVGNIERPVAAGWRRSLKRKVSSTTQRDRTRALDHDDARQVQLSTLMPAFSTAPFIF